jgi:hypothetical protein
MAALTTLASVKEYLAITTAGSDALITKLIARESGLIEQYTSRSFPSSLNIRKRLNGSGTPLLVLPLTPIIEVTLLEINGLAVPASDGVAYGYAYTPGGSAVQLVAGKFTGGHGSVVATWRSGYRTDETAEIPAQTGNDPVTVTPTFGGRAVYDAGVVDADGVAYALVANGPVAGQYSFSGGVYTFNASNSGVEVSMTYDYVPSPVEQACIEMVGLDMKQRDNLGVSSKSLAGETVTYTTKGITASVAEMLSPFRRRAPL